LCVCREAKEAQEGKRPKPRVVVREVDGERRTYVIVEPEVADRALVYPRYRGGVEVAGAPSADPAKSPMRKLARQILDAAGGVTSSPGHEVEPVGEESHGGRPRKHRSAAERQAAYRKRRSGRSTGNK